MITIDRFHVPRIFADAESAVNLASELENGDEDGWTYNVQLLSFDPKGKARIIVHDEDGYLIGWL